MEQEHRERQNFTQATEYETGSLPSRKEYHSRKRKAKKKKRKLKNPLIQILAFIFLLLPVIIGLLYYFQIFPDQNPLENNKYFDRVEFE